MDAIVYIGHGSRFQKGNEQFKIFVESVMPHVPCPVQEVAFLELTVPTIEDTMKKVIEQGATEILVVPVLLFSAAHFNRDIPEEVEKVQEMYPNVSFRMSKPFGIHQHMIDLVAKRILAAKQGDKRAAVLLVGRGSSESEPIQSLEEIGRLVEERVEMPVQTAFLTAGKPSFPEGLEQLTTQYEKVYVMPYLLFTGLLLKRMEKTTKAWEHDIILCQCLEFDEYMRLTLLERIEEVFNA